MIEASTDEESPGPGNGRAIVDDADAQQCLTFNLAQEVFAIDIRCVMEIIPFGRLTRIPLMPSTMRGVINLRGAVVPVLDLHGRFGWGKSTPTKKSCIVVYRALSQQGATPLGLMVDAVSEVIAIDTKRIEPAPHFGATLSRDYLDGMYKLDESFIMLLKPERAFDLEALADLLQHRSPA